MPKKDNKDPIYAKIKYHLPNDLVRRYANNMLVQTGQNEFVLSFFETYPPLHLDPIGDKKKVADETLTVDSNCVASIVIPPDVMPLIIEALQKHYEKSPIANTEVKS